MASTTSAGSSRLGMGMATALVIGNMIGSGVFLLPSALTAAAALTLWAFIGLDSATVPADDVADARRHPPFDRDRHPGLDPVA